MPDVVGWQEYELAQKVKNKGGSSSQTVANLCRYLASAASDGISGKLISAVWDPWEDLHKYKQELQQTNIYTLRRIVPKDRNKLWGER